MRHLIALIALAPLLGACFFDDVPPATECGGALGETCESNQYCDFPAADSCGSAGTGTCRLRPDADIQCAGDDAPVCGCDAQVYDSECHANAAGIAVLFAIADAQATDVDGVWLGAAPGGWGVAWQFNPDDTFVKYDYLSPCGNGMTCPGWGTVINRGTWSLQHDTIALTYTTGALNVGGATTPATLHVSGDCDALFLREVGPSGEAIYTPDPNGQVLDEHLDESGQVATGEMAHFTLPVDAGETVLVSTTAPGDVDLYVRMVAPPTTALYDDRSFGPTGNESVTITADFDGVLHIGVHGYEASAFTLTTTTLVDDVINTTDQADPGEMVLYTLPVSAGRAVEVSTTAHVDVDLYVRMGAAPTTALFDDRGFGPTGDETLTVVPATDGVLYIGVHGFEPGNFILRTRYPEPADLDESDKVEPGEMVRYSLPVVAGRTVVVRTSAPGDVDLYLRMGLAPTTVAFDRLAAGPAGDETLRFTPPADGTLHIGVYGYDATSFVLTTEIETEADLDESGQVAPGEMAYYTLPVLAGRPVVVATTSQEDVDLYVRMDAPPTTSVWDQRGFGPTGDERITVVPAADGVLHIGVHGFAPGAFELTTGVLEDAPLDVSDKVDAGEMRTYTLPVVAGRAVIVRTWADDDVDLYVRMGAAPTTSAYDQRAFTASGDESLTVVPTADGVLHIGVHGYAAASFDLTTELETDVDLDESGQVAAGQMVHYTLPVRAGQPVQVDTLADGDVDLYLRMDAPPTTQSWDKRADTPSGDESVVLTPVADGVLHIGVFGFTASSYTVLTSTPAQVQLDERDKVDAGEMVIFALPVVSGEAVEIRTSAPADVDLYVRMGAAPTTAVYDDRGFGPTGAETLVVVPDADGVLYIGVHGYEATTFELTTGAPTPPQLDESGQLAAGQMVVHTLPVRAGEAVVLSTFAAGDVDLYVRMGAAPTTFSYDDRAAGPDGDEQLIVVPAVDGVLHVGVRAFASTSYQLTTALQADTHLDVLDVVDAGEMLTWALPVVAGRSVMVRTASIEDVDLYVRMGAPPTTTTWDERAYTSSGEEWLIVTPTADGVLFVGVHAQVEAIFTLTTTD